MMLGHADRLSEQQFVPRVQSSAWIRGAAMLRVDTSWRHSNESVLGARRQLFLRPPVSFPFRLKRSLVSVTTVNRKGGHSTSLSAEHSYQVLCITTHQRISSTSSNRQRGTGLGGTGRIVTDVRYLSAEKGATSRYSAGPTHDARRRNRIGVSSPGSLRIAVDHVEVEREDSGIAIAWAWTILPLPPHIALDEARSSSAAHASNS